MIIESVRVRNFRSILDATVNCDSITVLVGRNGAGKSSFLRALDLFYTLNPRIDEEDFYNRDADQEIVISITFKDLSSEAQEKFSAYAQGDTLTVDRVFKLKENRLATAYHGSRLQNPQFNTIRMAGTAKDKKELYESLRKDSSYSSLPPWRNQVDSQAALDDWEVENSDKCERLRDDGQFFGFKEVGQGFMGKYSKYLFIPAVRDASDDATEGRGSVFAELMDLVVRSVLANKDNVQKFKKEIKEKYKAVFDVKKHSELENLAQTMTQTLATYVPEAAVAINWLPFEDMEFPLPRANVRLVEDGYHSLVSRVGHGLQRAFILTILQHLTQAQLQVKSNERSLDSGDRPVPNTKLPGLVLAIEEPELYQHPTRQRHLARILNQLARNAIPGVAERTQVIYATHSPLFVGIDRINQIRLLRKVELEREKPRVSTVISTTLDAVAEELWVANGKRGARYTEKSLTPRLQTIMSPLTNEGFFADLVVLVEGEGDRAALLGVAQSLSCDFESMGICVVPCSGKNCLDRPLVIFRQFGIPIYTVWDSDKDDDGKTNPKDNHKLLRLHGSPQEDWPCQITDSFACFENKLETTLRSEIGQEEFESYFENCREEFGIESKNQALKNPYIIASIIKLARRDNRSSITLEKIVRQILIVRNGEESD